MIENKKQGIIKPPEDVNISQRIHKKGQCPICKKKEMQNLCVLDVSGYAFCYGCISDYVNEHNRCPITLINASMSNIRKIYIN